MAPPYVVSKRRKKGLHKSAAVRGFLKDLMDKLSVGLDAEFLISNALLECGSKDKTGNWTGIIGNLISRVSWKWVLLKSSKTVLPSAERSIHPKYYQRVFCFICRNPTLAWPPSQ